MIQGLSVQVLQKVSQAFSTSTVSSTDNCIFNFFIVTLWLDTVPWYEYEYLQYESADV